MNNELYKSSFGPSSVDDNSFKSQNMPISSWGEEPETAEPVHTPPIEQQKTEKTNPNKEMDVFRKTIGWIDPKTTRNPVKDAFANGINRIKCLFKVSTLTADKLPQNLKSKYLWYLFAMAGLDIAAMLALITVGFSLITNIAEIITLVVVNFPPNIMVVADIFGELVKMFAKCLVAWGVLIVARLVGVELNKENNESIVKIVAGVLLAVFLLVCF